LILFRKATLKDTNHIKQLLISANQNFEDIGDHLDSCMLAELDGIIIGVGGLKLCPPMACLCWLSILPEYQNQGYGDGLVRALINLADRRNIEKIYVAVNNAQNLFKKIGFVPTNMSVANIKCGNCQSFLKDKAMELDINNFFNSHNCKLLG